MTLDEPTEVTVARMRGTAWIYMIRTERGTGVPHWEYEIHTDRDHLPPTNLALYCTPVWVGQSKRWEKMSEAKREVWLRALADIADRLSEKWGLKRSGDAE